MGGQDSGLVLAQERGLKSRHSPGMRGMPLVLGLTLRTGDTLGLLVTGPAQIFIPAALSLRRVPLVPKVPCGLSDLVGLLQPEWFSYRP